MTASITGSAPPADPKSPLSGPLPGASRRLVGMTVEDLRHQLADLPDWAEVRIDVGFAQPAIWEADYRQGLLLLVADNDPELIAHLY
ncbi:hypothetical protein [Streptomyces sp. HUAS TT7]|uniref:hypothetical protein n=1 Tax=Streptomyces sp. HUAS TT7 TaxID=3447507 RepID=UPI003F65DD4B